jgi:anti-sigma factor RsiW
MSFTPAELEAYLDEALPAEWAAAVEDALRRDATLLNQLAAINARRDAGVHSLGEIWRRARLSCPNRQQLANYLLGILPDGEAHYIRFHLTTVGCRYCQANVADLEAQARGAEPVQPRRQKYFQSSAGRLPPR